MYQETRASTNADGHEPKKTATSAKEHDRARSRQPTRRMTPAAPKRARRTSTPAPSCHLDHEDAEPRGGPRVASPVPRRGWRERRRQGLSPAASVLAPRQVEHARRAEARPRAEPAAPSGLPVGASRARGKVEGRLAEAVRPGHELLARLQVQVLHGLPASTPVEAWRAQRLSDGFPILLEWGWGGWGGVLCVLRRSNARLQWLEDEGTGLCVTGMARSGIPAGFSPRSGTTAVSVANRRAESEGRIGSW